MILVEDKYRHLETHILTVLQTFILKTKLLNENTNSVLSCDILLHYNNCICLCLAIISLCDNVI